MEQVEDDQPQEMEQLGDNHPSEIEPVGDNNLLVNLLPEIIEIIAGYLSVEDLLKCCSCSKSMRKTFSADNIWRPRYDKKLVEYLKATPCKVEPHFIPPKFKNSSLDSIPKRRREFMYQNHLMNNWRQGRSVERVVETCRECHESTSQRVYYNSIFHLFLTSNCVVGVYPDKIELVDISGPRMVKAASDIKVPVRLRSEHDFRIIAYDGMVIFIYQTLVQVYQIDFAAKESILKNVFFIEDSQKIENVQGVENLRRLMEGAKQKCSKQLVNTAVEGRLLILIFKDESTLHVWDIITGLKVKTQECKIQQGSIVDFKGTKTMKLILCTQGKRQLSSLKNPQTFLVYDLVAFTFLPFRESFSGDCGFCCKSNYVAIWTDKILTVYDYINYKKLLENQPIQSFCKVLKDNFVFLEDKKLKIFLPRSQKVKFLSLQCGNELQVMSSVQADWFEILRHKFIQVTSGYSSALYEVKENLYLKESSLKLWFQPCNFFLNRNTTGYIVRCGGTGNVIHFW